SAFVLYSLEQSLRKQERHIASLKREIRTEKENIKLLNAEWSFLIQPSRLERLAEEHLNLRQTRPYQLARRDELTGLVPLKPSVTPLGNAGDTPDNTLKDLQ
ncbi:MAG: cell division protein FtsL, partial [Aestuariivirgaceae bacterium]